MTGSGKGTCVRPRVFVGLRPAPPDGLGSAWQRQEWKPGGLSRLWRVSRRMCVLPLKKAKRAGHGGVRPNANGKTVFSVKWQTVCFEARSVSNGTSSDMGYSGKRRQTAGGEKTYGKRIMSLSRSHFAVLVLLWASLALSGCAVKPLMGQKHTLAPEKYAPILRDTLRHGDWIVMRTVRIVGNMVATVTQKPFSHAALYDAEYDSAIEATVHGVHRSSLEDLLRKSQRILVIRPFWASEANSRVAVERARELLGKSYDYTGLMGLGSRDRYYCTELCMEAYQPFIRKNEPDNPLPRIIQPGHMYYWGTIIYDTGP